MDAEKVYDPRLARCRPRQAGGAPISQIPIWGRERMRWAVLARTGRQDNKGDSPPSSSWCPVQLRPPPHAPPWIGGCPALGRRLCWVHWFWPHPDIHPQTHPGMRFGRASLLSRWHVRLSITRPILRGLGDRSPIAGSPKLILCLPCGRKQGTQRRERECAESLPASESFACPFSSNIIGQLSHFATLTLTGTGQMSVQCLSTMFRRRRNGTTLIIAQYTTSSCLGGAVWGAILKGHLPSKAVMGQHDG